MPAFDASTPVVVLPSARHGGLGIVRSLGRMGVPVYVVDPDPWAPALRSRYCRGRWIRDIQGPEAEDSLAFLGQVGKKLGRRAILIPTTDTTAMFVDEHSATLRQWFCFPARSEGLARLLCSKKGMYTLARQSGVPTAATAFPQCRRDVLAYLETARFPIMLKGIYGDKLKQRAGRPVSIMRSADELLESYDLLENPAEPNLMLQEYIPGGDDTVWMFNGYFNTAGECVIGFTGRKLRQNPVYTGATCLGVCLANDEVARITRDFMQAIGYRGVLDIGYRYDARDGQYKVLDVNPRIGATFRLFVAENGMDVTRALYLDLTGQAVERGHAPDGRKWIVEDCDIVSCFRYYRDGQLTLGDWLRSMRGIRECALWASDDPVPLTAMLAADGRDLIFRVRQKLAGFRTPMNTGWAKS